MKKLLIFILISLSIVACNKNTSQLVELDILERVDKEVSEDLDKISGYEIKEVEEKVGEKQVEIPDSDTGKSLDALLLSFNTVKAKDELYRLKSDGLIDEDKYSELLSFLDESNGDTSYLLERIVDEPEFDSLLIGTYDQETIDKIKLLLKDVDWNQLSIRDSSGFKTKLINDMIEKKETEDFEERWKDYDEEIKDTIKKVEALDQLHDMKVKSSSYKKMWADEGLKVVVNLSSPEKYETNPDAIYDFGKNEGFKVLKGKDSKESKDKEGFDEVQDYYNALYNEAAEYISKHPEIKSVWDYGEGYPEAQNVLYMWLKMYHDGNRTDPYDANVWYGKEKDLLMAELEKRLMVLIEERNPGLQEISNYIKENEDKTSPAKYINTLGNGNYITMYGFVVPTDDNREYIVSLPLAKTNGAPFWQDIEREVFKLNNPGVEFTHDDTPKHSYKKGTFDNTGYPLWITRDINDLTVNFKGEVYLPILYDNENIPCFTEYTQGSRYAFYGWGWPWGNETQGEIRDWTKTNRLYVAIDIEYWESSGLMKFVDSNSYDHVMKTIREKGTWK